MFEFKNNFFLSRVGNSPETTLTSLEMKNLKQKIEQKILGDHTHDDLSDYSTDQLSYLLDSLQEKHIEQIILLQKIQTLLTETNQIKKRLPENEQQFKPTKMNLSLV